MLRRNPYLGFNMSKSLNFSSDIEIREILNFDTIKQLFQPSLSACFI